MLCVRWQRKKVTGLRSEECRALRKCGWYDRANCNIAEVPATRLPFRPASCLEYVISVIDLRS